jgi:hypothetical protein
MTGLTGSARQVVLYHEGALSLLARVNGSSLQDVAILRAAIADAVSDRSAPTAPISYQDCGTIWAHLSVAVHSTKSVVEQARAAWGGGAECVRLRECSGSEVGKVVRDGRRLKAGERALPVTLFKFYAVYIYVCVASLPVRYIVCIYMQYLTGRVNVGYYQRSASWPTGVRSPCSCSQVLTHTRALSLLDPPHLSTRILQEGRRYDVYMHVIYIYTEAGEVVGAQDVILGLRQWKVCDRTVGPPTDLILPKDCTFEALVAAVAAATGLEGNCRQPTPEPKLPEEEGEGEVVAEPEPEPQPALRRLGLAKAYARGPPLDHKSAIKLKVRPTVQTRCWLWYCSVAHLSVVVHSGTMRKCR